MLLKEVISTKNYDYVVWVDNDAYITNQEIRFDFMCSVDKNLKLILSSEDTNRDIKALDKNLDYNLLHNLTIQTLYYI